MERIRLIHWNAAEAEVRAGRLAALGYQVVWALPDGPGLMSAVRAAQPDAFVIDLSRLPSQGRDVALSLRTIKAARAVPIVFVGGDPVKTARTRQLLPDAVFAEWDGIAAAVQQALSRPAAAPSPPLSVFAGYSGRPLPAKLGIKPGMTVALVNAPPDFAATLGDIPDGVTLTDAATTSSQLILWFVRARAELENGMAATSGDVQINSLWIIWPKKASGIVSDVSEPVVRAAGLAAGLVDFKIAAMDATWSGLKFRRRKTQKAS